MKLFSIIHKAWRTKKEQDHSCSGAITDAPSCRWKSTTGPLIRQVGALTYRANPI